MRLNEKQVGAKPLSSTQGTMDISLYPKNSEKPSQYVQQELDMFGFVFQKQDSGKKITLAPSCRKNWTGTIKDASTGVRKKSQKYK